MIRDEIDGPRAAAVVVSFEAGQLLRVPVEAECRPPKPVLGPVRRQTLGAVATDTPAVRRFRVTNTGDGRLECTVTADQPWIEILTRELKVGPGKKRRVEYRLNTPAMPTGANAAVIRVQSNGGAADVAVSVNVVEPAPELELLGDADLGTVSADGPATGHLSLRNVGVGLLALKAVPDDPRVTVTPTELTVAPGLPVKLAVAVAPGGLPGGPHAVGVRFSSNGGGGLAEVRFRLPVESIDAPAVIDLGDRPAGQSTGDTLRLRNTGPDPVTLTIRADDPWLRPGSERVVLRPGDLVAVPFRVDLAQETHGPVSTTIWLEGRTVRQAVTVRVVARKVDLVAVPHVLVLGDMTPGEERAFTLQVVNKGDIGADLRESHTPGDLEVWVRRQSVPPGATATVAGRVKMNARGYGRNVRATVRLADECQVRFAGTVARPLGPRILAGAAAGGGLVAGAALGATVGWFFGVVVAAAGLVAAGVLLAVEGQ